MDVQRQQPVEELCLQYRTSRRCPFSYDDCILAKSSSGTRPSIGCFTSRIYHAPATAPSFSDIESVYPPRETQVKLVKKSLVVKVNLILRRMNIPTFHTKLKEHINEQTCIEKYLNKAEQAEARLS